MSRNVLVRQNIDSLRLIGDKGTLVGGGALWPKTRWGWDTGIVVLPGFFTDRLRQLSSAWSGIIKVSDAATSGLPPHGRYRLESLKETGVEEIGVATLHWFAAAKDAVALIEGEGVVPSSMVLGDLEEPTELPRWKLLELGALAVELELAEIGAPVRITYDEHIRDVRTGDSRQVDVAIRYRLAGREFLRTVEVTTERIGSEQVDETEGKARRIGAHRTTLLTPAGFTEPAQRRIEQNSVLLDGIHLRVPRESEWPLLWPSPTVSLKSERTGIEVSIPLLPLAYADALTDAASMLLLVGNADTPDLAGAVVAVLSISCTPEANPQRMSLYLLPESGPPVEADGVVPEWGRDAFGRLVLSKLNVYWVREMRVRPPS